MNKSELIEALAGEANITQKMADEIVNSLFQEMTRALLEDDRIEIRGFGSFVVRYYEPYTGRNPRTGEKINVPPKKLPFFKVGKELRERIDSKPDGKEETRPDEKEETGLPSL